MTYEIELNNKIFTSIDAEIGKLTFKLDDADVFFFHDWAKKFYNSNLKSDYVKDIKFKKILNSGTLKNVCDIKINNNEDKVQLIYDYEIFD